MNSLDDLLKSGDLSQKGHDRTSKTINAKLTQAQKELTKKPTQKAKFKKEKIIPLTKPVFYSLKFQFIG